MQLLVLTVLGVIALILSVAFDLGGTVGGLIFLTFLFVGALLRAWAPLVEWLRGPAARL